MSTIITDNPYTFTVADNMNINAVFVGPSISITATDTDTVYLYNKYGQTYTWNLTPGTNIYDGSEAGFELNNLYSIYKYTTNSGVSNTNTITSIDISDSSIKNIGKYAFYGCIGLTSITFSEGITTIDRYAFQGCTGLTSLTLPSGLRYINDRAFLNCIGLTSLTLPEGLTEINTYAFSGCTNLTSINLPNTIDRISNGAFYGCTSLTSITLPSGLINLGTEAFYGCSGLTSLTIPEGISLTTIESGDFNGCTGLTSLTIPEGITRIGGNAFKACTGLTTLTLPSSLTYIGNGAFWNCNKVSTFTIPSSVISIYNNSFNYTRWWLDASDPLIKDNIYLGIRGANPTGTLDLSQLSFRLLSSQSFYYITTLTSVILPSTVEIIGDSAFAAASKMSSLYIYATTPPTLGSSAFSSNSCTIYVPAASVDAYKAASGWSDLSARIQAIP